MNPNYVVREKLYIKEAALLKGPLLSLAWQVIILIC
jgi:hypothetical protein